MRIGSIGDDRLAVVQRDIEVSHFISLAQCSRRDRGALLKPVTLTFVLNAAGQLLAKFCRIHVEAERL